MDTVETANDGSLTLSSELLGGPKPRTLYRVERIGSGLLLREEDEQHDLSPEEWLAEWDDLADAVTKAWKSDKSSVEVISEMRR